MVRLLQFRHYQQPLDVIVDQALFLAAECGYAMIAHALLAKNANPNTARNGWTPLLGAVYKGHRSVVEVLLNADGINIGQTLNCGATPLILAVIHGHAELVSDLLAKNVPVDDADRFGATALNRAVKIGHANIIQMLLDAGADPHKVCNNGATPWTIAVESGNAAIVDMLSRAKEAAR